MQPVTAISAGLGPIRWEAHACLPLVPGQDMSGLHRYRAAGFHHVSINVGMDMTPFATVVQTLADFRAWLARHEPHFRLVGTVADIHRAREQGRMAVSFDLEGSTMLLDDPAMVGLYASLGVRQMLLAYNRDNSCAGGCHGAGGGLTALGREMVAAGNAAGITLDCAHASERASLQIMAVSTRPVVFSHTNIKALHEHPRTVSDRQIRACADQDGVIGLTGLSLFLGDPAASVASFVRQIDYLAERVGTRHIGIGLDTELCPADHDLPAGVDAEYWWPARHYGQPHGHTQLQPEALPELVRQLADRGYTAADIDAILGGNFLRIACQTWPSAAA
ncbi:membrane dipeptidase [Pseudomonas oryzihabitans]|uniref:membrane dipeptidase n=1 Tax=Pseudomonas oryzihabitans TaxID=47885 RepID=UPI0011A7D2B5|nr:membrane dipeptidase [Pseudomonas oryzihabitans]